MGDTSKDISSKPFDFSFMMKQSDATPKNSSSSLSKRTVYGALPIDKAFDCELCSKSYKTKSSLRRHFQSHHKEEYAALPTMNCPICGIGETTRELLLRHCVQHLHERERELFECPVLDCTTLLRGAKLMETHVSITHKDDNLVCKVCSSNFKTFDSLWKHYHLYHGLLTKERETILDKYHEVKGFGRSYRARALYIRDGEDTADQRDVDSESPPALVRESPSPPETLEQALMKNEEVFDRNKLIKTEPEEVTESSIVSPSSMELLDSILQSFTPSAMKVEHPDLTKASVKSQVVDSDSLPPMDLSCHHCSITFADLSLWLLHVSFHSLDSSTPFVCQACGIDTENKFAFATHLLTTAHPIR